MTMLFFMYDIVYIYIKVTVIGDGKPENKYFIVGEKLWKENALLKLIEDLPTPSPVKQTKDVLSKMIYRSVTIVDQYVTR